MNTMLIFLSLFFIITRITLGRETRWIPFSTPAGDGCNMCYGQKLQSRSHTNSTWLDAEGSGAYRGIGCTLAICMQPVKYMDDGN